MLHVHDTAAHEHRNSETVGFGEDLAEGFVAGVTCNRVRRQRPGGHGRRHEGDARLALLVLHCHAALARSVIAGCRTYAERMSQPSSIVWLRDDLRVADNPALLAAAERGAPVVVLYLLDEVSPGQRPLGGASRWWLHHSLAALEASLAGLGTSLTLRRGAANDVLPALVREVGADAVFWNRRYSAAREVDAELKARLREDGVEVRSFAASVLYEPWTLTTGAGAPYKVFTPFWKAALASEEPRDPVAAPDALEGRAAQSEQLEGWQLLPTRPDWAEGLRATWTPGEQGAHERLEQFVEEGLALYHRRDEPGIEATSRLSPHLRFGEISPHQIRHRVQEGISPEAARNRAKFLSEVGWREFSVNILFHWPDLCDGQLSPRIR